MNDQDKEICPSLRAEKVKPLSTLCTRVIASNLERYPAHAFISLAETEWEGIVQLKYKLTQPKTTYLKPGNSTLSGGRKMPVISDKFISDIENECPALSRSLITDELVWKDCVDFKFKRNGPLRPPWLDIPWKIRIEEMKSNGRELMKRVDNVRGFCHDEEDMKAFRTHLSLLETRPMSTSLLLASGIGKIVKKVIKRMKMGVNVSEIDNEVINTLQRILDSWQTLASGNEFQTHQIDCSGKNRFTSVEQHAYDMEMAERAQTWRELFRALQQRQERIVKTRAVQMRKIRDELEADRPKLLSTNVKTVSNRRLADKLLDDQNSKLLATNAAVGLSKIKKLRQASAMSVATMRGKIGSKSNNVGFGASIASCGTKRKIVSNSSIYSGRNPREVHLEGGKKMKLPKQQLKRK